MNNLFRLDGRVALVTAASKGIGEAMARGMAQDRGADNIRGNAICPGLLKVRFSEALWSDKNTRERFVKRIPSGRVGTAEDIKGLAIYLASAASAYCTGGVYMVDGGYAANQSPVGTGANGRAGAIIYHPDRNLR